MSLAQVYLKAAEMIDIGYVGYACDAIGMVSSSGYGSGYDMDMFALYFKPKQITTYRPWFGDSRKGKNQEHRVLALLFMHAMAEAGDL